MILFVKVIVNPSVRLPKSSLWIVDACLCKSSLICVYTAGSDRTGEGVGYIGEFQLSWKDVLLYAELANMCGATVAEVRCRDRIVEPRTLASLAPDLRD